MRNRFCLIYVGLLFTLLLSSNRVFAKQDVGFVVDPVIPSTQLDYSKGFFYIETKPGEKQKLVVNVSSTQKEPITVSVGIDNAISTESGIIDFSEPNIKNRTLTEPLSDLVTIKEQKITLKDYETKEVTFELNPPSKPYKGIKWAALKFNAKDNSGDYVDEMVDVSNEYRIGIIISESKDIYNNGETLNLMDVGASLSYGRKVIQASIENPEPKTIENLTMRAKLIENKNGKIVKEKEVTNYAFAPNSTMPFIFDWGLGRLVGGEYKLTMYIFNDEKNWHLEKEFYLSSDEAKRINNASPVTITTPFWMKIVSIILFSYVVLVAIFIKRRQKNWFNLIEKKKKRIKSKYRKDAKGG